MAKITVTSTSVGDRTQPPTNGTTGLESSRTRLVPAHVRERVNGLIRPDGWDLEDSRAITGSTCNAALRFLSELLQRHPSIPDPDAASAISDGSIALQWRVNGSSIMVLIDKESPSYYRQCLDRQGGYVAGAASRDAIMSEMASALL